MTSKQILKYLSDHKDARLCMGYCPDVPGGITYWLSPSRVNVRADQAERLTALLKPCDDALPFKDAVSQTWRV